MPCIPLPKIEFPALPFPLTLSLPELPPLPTLPDLCCKLPPLPIPKIPILLPPVIITPELIALLKKYQAAMSAYLDALPLECPKE